jgi:hypothetical protein
MIFVAMGSDGRSTPVPRWHPITDEDREQRAGAQRRVVLRADIETAMAAQRYTEDGTAPAVLLRFLAAPTDINCSRRDRDALDRRNRFRAGESMDSQHRQ